MPSDLERRFRALAALRARQNRQNEEWEHAWRALAALPVETIRVPRSFLEELDELASALARTPRRANGFLHAWPARPGLRG